VMIERSFSSAAITDRGCRAIPVIYGAESWNGSREASASRSLPGVIPAATITNELAVNFDLFVTCLNLAGLSLPQDQIIDGRDLLPLLRGEAPSPHATFVYYDVRTPTAIRSQHWKYIRRSLTDIGPYWPLEQAPFLFDLDRDPNESYSLIEDQPEPAPRIILLLETFEAGMKANLRGWQ
jgi:arylsulfatase A